MTDPQTAIARYRSGGFQGHWVLDPAGSKVEFRVKHFWGLVTVRGWFDTISGEASVDGAGTISGQLTFDANSLNTKNARRDKHLRSADFFHAERHPSVLLTITEAVPQDNGQVAVNGTIEAAGHTEPVSFTGQVEEAGEDAITLRADLVVDRFAFDMTWSPLSIAAKQATGTVVARFVRG
jgi:polyisoprenoid-binding protein YceI